VQAPELVAEVQRVIPDLDAVEERLHQEPERVLAHALKRPDRPSARAIVGAPPDEIPPELLEPYGPGLERTLDGARRAVRKIRREGRDADLQPDERAGTEAIILMFGRPAILIQDGRFFPPPTPWEKLEDKRDAIQATFASVGRIEVTGHPRYKWVGTGFLVFDDVVLTNRHVVKEFARPVGGSRWEFERGMKARIDFGEEFGSAFAREFPFTEIVGVHEDVDLALLRVAKKAARRSLPSPLVVDADPRRVKKGREVYVVGYPAADPGRNDPEVMARIFANIFEVKRLQPGTIRRRQGQLFQHDCSTLGGNSGSCILDLEKVTVIGLHFQGTYLKSNTAITLAELANDPLVKGNVAFA